MAFNILELNFVANEMQTEEVINTSNTLASQPKIIQTYTKEIY